ncbi:hypothetical protein UFOVP529_108 [uncultured Caudovirales phage]|uniref:Uncharacterized protein n=1 Tax=uncultured Caudovirales phage TaxID=2100421 RepID=A0A6J5MWM4_9CAUD|nr:hypothetical protein UFOVP529_108 [uncultured Caudovirales phage]CAB4190259.1 hypothetical protein UFOVP1191_46 [uncultured Caudovirales phage]CAB4194331.1 hypothetical protein UFOVP1252_13 [uncultured Caudovirales phage]
MAKRQYVRSGGSWVDIGNPVAGALVQKYTTLVGDNSNTSFTVSHGLGNIWVNVQVYDNTTGKYIIPDHTVNLTSGTPNGTVTITFLLGPAVNQYRVVITG